MVKPTRMTTFIKTQFKISDLESPSKFGRSDGRTLTKMQKNFVFKKYVKILKKTIEMFQKILETKKNLDNPLVKSLNNLQFISRDNFYIHKHYNTCSLFTYVYTYNLFPLY